MLACSKHAQLAHAAHPMYDRRDLAEPSTVVWELRKCFKRSCNAHLLSLAFVAASHDAWCWPLFGLGDRPCPLLHRDQPPHHTTAPLFRRPSNTNFEWLEHPLPAGEDRKPDRQAPRSRIAGSRRAEGFKHRAPRYRIQLRHPPAAPTTANAPHRAD